MLLDTDISTWHGYGHLNKQEEKENEVGHHSFNYSSIIKNLNFELHKLDYLIGLDKMSHTYFNKFKIIQNSFFLLEEVGYNLMVIFHQDNLCEDNFY